MVRQLSVLLGIGMVILWIAELNVNIAPWLTWFDLVAAVAAFFIAGAINERSTQNARVTSPVALSVGLFALWIISLAGTTVPLWQAWWNFAFACAFLLTGLGVSGTRTREWTTSNFYGYHPFGNSLGGNLNVPRYDRGSGQPLHSAAYDYGRTGSVPASRGPRNYQRTDARIEEDVYERLSDQWQFDASDLRVEVKNGEVILRGIVESRRDRRLAEDIIDSVRGVKDIRNELELKGRQAKAPFRAA